MKFYTITVKSNLFADIYVTFDGMISFDKSYLGAYREDYMKPINKENILKFIKREAKWNENFKVTNVDELSIELVIEEADMSIFTRMIPYRDGKIYALSITREQQINDWQKQIKQLEEEKEEKENDISDLEDEINEIESDIYDLKQRIKEALK